MKHGINKMSNDEKQIKNGVTMPRAGSKTRAVWDTATKISEKENRPATREEVLSACMENGIAKATAATQYSHWKKYYGLTGRIVDPNRAAKVTPPPAKRDAKKDANVVKIPTNEPSTVPVTAGTKTEAETTQDNSCYDEGWDAYCEGKSKSDNPYQKAESQHDTWNSGFEDADKA